MVKEQQQVAADLAQLRQLETDGSSAGRLPQWLVKAAIRIRGPKLAVLIWIDLVFGDVVRVLGELWQSSQVVGPRLVEEKTPPEGHLPRVNLVLVHLLLVPRHQARVQVETDVLRHTEAHAAVDPAPGLPPTARLTY